MSSNSASIHNLHKGVFIDYRYEYSTLCANKDNLVIRIGQNGKDALENAKLYKILKNINCKIDIVDKKWDKALNIYETEHENFYDEKFKENTKRQKGKNQKRRFSFL